MKKSIMFGLLLTIGATTFTSCKKEYNCSCKKVYTGSSSTTSYQDDIYTFKDTRARAESRCNEQEGTGSDVVGGAYSRECEIK